jgi:hypothetical protein
MDHIFCFICCVAPCMQRHRSGRSIVQSDPLNDQSNNYDDRHWQEWLPRHFGWRRRRQEEWNMCTTVLNEPFSSGFHWSLTILQMRKAVGKITEVPTARIHRPCCSGNYETLLQHRYILWRICPLLGNGSVNIPEAYALNNRASIVR